MADDVVKRLLIKLGIDGADAVRFISQLQDQLDGMYQKSKAQTSERKSAQSDDLAAMAKQLDAAKQQTDISQQQVANLRQQIESKQITVKQIQEEITKEKQALDIRQSTLRIMVQQGEVSGGVIKSLESQIALERQKLNLQQAQLRATGLSASAQKEQGAIGGAIATGARSLFGGGLIGGVAGGLIGGMAAVEGIQLLMESVRKLGEALMEASGPAQTLRLEFEKLATNKGNDPAELLQKMRVATHGMAADAALFQVANVTLRSNMKLTTDQMVKMLGMTVDLARLNAKDVPQALNAFTRSMETGQPFILARVLGLTNLQRGMQQLPRGIDPAVAATVRMNQVYMAMENALSKGVKPVLLTLPDLFVQVEAAEKNFVDGVAEGVFHTGSFSKNIQAMSKALVDAMPKIVETGKAIGEGLSNAVKWLIDHWPEIKTGMEAVVAIKLVDWALGGAAALWKLAAAIQGVNAAKLGSAIAGVLPGAGKLVGAISGAGVSEAETGVAASAVGSPAGLVTAAIVTGILGTLGVVWIIDYLKNHPEKTSAAGSAVRNYDYSTGIKNASLALHDAAKAVGSFVPNIVRGARTVASDTIGGFLFGPQQTIPLGRQTPKAGEIADQFGVSTQAHSPGYKKPGEAGDKSGYVDIAALKRDEVLRQTIRREGAKVELQIAKDEIDAEQEILKTKYEMGLLQLDDYLAQEKASRHKAMADSDAEIRLEGESRKAAAKVSVQPTRTAEGIEVQPTAQAVQLEKDQEVLIDKETEQRINKNHEETRKQDVADEMKSLEDKKAANQAYQQELIKIQKESLAEQTALVEKQFKEGNLGPDQYIAQRRDMIQKEAAIVADGLQKELEDATKTEKEKADIRIKGIEAALVAQKQLTDFDLQQNQIQVQAMENSYAKIRSGLQEQQAAAQLNVQQRVPGARGNELEILEKMTAANEKYIQQLITEASTLHNQPQLWAQTVDKIKQATEEQIKLNQQLRQAKDFAKPLSDLFEVVAGAFNSAGLGKIGAVLSNVQQSFGQLSTAREAGTPSIVSQVGGLFSKKKPGQQALAVSDPATKAAKATDDYTATVEADVAKLKSLSAEEGAAKVAAAKKLGEDLASISDAYRKPALSAAEAINLLGNAARTAAHAMGPPEAEAKAPDITQMKLPPTALPMVAPAAAQMPIQPWQMKQPSVSADDIPAGVSSSKGGKGSGGDDSEKKFSGFIGMLAKGETSLGSFVKGISGAVSGIGNFIGAMKGAKSGAGGAVSGGMAGLSMGMQVGGPMGAAIGAVGGAILGGIMGHKQAEIQHDVQLIQAQMQGILDQLSQGTISMATAIQNLRNERQAAIQMLSGTKGAKGKKGQASQLQSVLSQIDAQIQQLVSEQQQLLDQMDQSILTMSQGIYWQPVLTQLDSIVKQYQQFASAAQGNTQQVAAANEFLTDSLQSYSQTMQQTFLSDQEQAIQNAQTLLQLEQQQAEMTNQYQSQVYGILSQGVTSRQLSGAQTKGAELEALNEQYSQQQLQMQQEIAVAAYKYQIQQKIFGLASTQVGLEMEMVAVQDEQANNSMQSVLVMQQAMEAINAALASGNLPSSLTGATSTGGQMLSGILQLLGINTPNVPGLGNAGGQNYLTQIPGTWQPLVSYLNNIDPNFTLDVLQAMMSPPGSAARQNLIALLNNPEYELGNDLKGSQYGTELSGFENWISTGAALPPGQMLPPSQPGGYQEGTTFVPQTGIAQLEQGEAVIPSGMNPWGDASGGTPFSMGVNQQSVNGSTGAALSEANLQVEQQIYQMVMARVSAEWTLIQAKMELLQQEQSGSNSVTSFEGGMQKVYENRGRYGSGGVRTEYL